jgi:chloramphenicol-sensitive protein RarD
MQPGDGRGTRSGMAFGFSAHVLWGVFPLYWGFLAPASPLEVLAARVTFSLLLMVAIVAVAGQWRTVRAVVASRRSVVVLGLAAFIVSINWGVFIWAIDNGHVVDASLGYFINPLVSVLLGVAVLAERLRRLQWGAVGLAGVAVLYATLNLDRPPWVALILAVTFGCYGLAKKVAGIDAISSLAVEMAILCPFAITYLWWLLANDRLALGGHGWVHSLAMAGSGPVTALPLLLFGAASQRIPLSVLGLMQYVGPSIQLVVGIWWFGEEMSAQRWVSFIGVWVALVVFTVDAVTVSRRRGPTPVAAPAPVGSGQGNAQHGGRS